MELSILNLLLLAVGLVCAAPSLTSYSSSTQLTPYLTPMRCGNKWSAGRGGKNPRGQCVESGCYDECRHGALISSICPRDGQKAQDCCVHIPCGTNSERSFCLNRNQKCEGGTLSWDLHCSAGNMGCCVLDKPTQSDGSCAPKDQLHILCGNFPTDPCCAPHKAVQKPNPPPAVEKYPIKTEKAEERVSVVGPDDGPPKGIEYTDGCSGMLAWFGMC